MKKKRLLFVVALLILQGLRINAQSTFPVNDIADPKERCYAFINATIVTNAQTTLQNATLVIRKGKIEAVGAKAAVPKDAVVVDCKGKYIYPSFIDMYSDYGTDAPQRAAGGGFRGSSQMLSNTKGAYGWNQAIRSETDAAKIFAVNDAKAKELRAIGFGTVLTHQMDGISRGTGAVVTLATEKENMAMLKEKASANYSFNKGSSTQDYPTSLMGCIALLRQNFLDAQWYKTKPVTEGTNLSLQAFLDNQSLPQIFDANDKWNDLRADKVGDEFGVQYIIKAGGNEYQRIGEVKATNASFIVPLNFPQAMDVEDPADARFVSLSDMKHWEMAPTNPAAFEKASINFALTTNGLKETNIFLANLRKAIQQGLSEQKALKALTETPATLLGMYDKVGSLEAGKLANFLIVSAPVFSDKAVIYQNWIQGNKYLLKEDGWQDIRGNYTLVINNTTNTLSIKGEAGKPSAEIIGVDTTKVDLTIKDKLVMMVIDFKKDSIHSARLNGVISEENWGGTGQTVAGSPISWTATKTSGQSAVADTAKGKKTESPVLVTSPVTYPFNGYGFTEMPKQQNILIKNATVWTNEKEGILANSDVLIKNGKIAAIGKNLSDAAAKIIDGTGKHLSAGIIDEHSHIAGTGGINECSQSVTSEVRIADIIDPEDVDIYRQLSGGVTSSHILHGSCNTIGGQTQLIKLRWGANAEQLRFAGSDPFIKFALGENVKRSYSNSSNRFPDTRMGVEQVLTDAFTRARDYEAMGPGKRRDLELDALVEIMNKKRFITCHSYVQSEITSAMRVAEKFGFKVNTFTHILEGYKVADKMKAHGANASTFSDWWSYKMEVVDAIPQNAYLMQKEGINVAINSDDGEMARRLNQEAAKSVKYTDMSEEDALKMVTLNPATMLHVADKTGSIKAGKDADLVLWSDNPLSIYAKAEKTIVDGVVYYDIEKDKLLREGIAKERARLIQKMIGAKKGGEKTSPATPSFRERNYCEEDHHEGKTFWGRIDNNKLSTDNQ
ncbi:MAG: N-acetylglucosamine-6-phosphate deacetylase [Ferruginibacter sp.]|uniref:amidohydrolase family protein n=1 Tax=Ferruginibacter sp. TaxID=1940288 RepID=UPI002657AFFD|nr:amidohydrolase family protein [Ferruginibacter sp.]MDB5280120.1 N-acetylglucosamine-6-phosphate deacetylase [Ferruginibacter sp.]